jgi:hypothetical protein
MLLRIALAASLLLAATLVAMPPAAASSCYSEELTVQKGCRDGVGYCDYWVSTASQGACVLRAEAAEAPAPAGPVQAGGEDCHDDVVVNVQLGCRSWTFGHDCIVYVATQDGSQGCLHQPA